jgi:hypothetical protein
MYFAIRVGARRLSDTADCLPLAGYTDAAGIAAEQARLVGSMQRPIVARDFARAAAAPRDLAPHLRRVAGRALLTGAGFPRPPVGCFGSG